jgi:hypothetical protein
LDTILNKVEKPNASRQNHQEVRLTIAFSKAQVKAAFL